ncbi:MAG: TIGR04282 family arsenosugar biosynthesis glycosyltransferase [Pseudomonadota bacterium]
MRGILIVFAKAPRPGRVKTRLARALGAAAAARLQVRLLERALASARRARCAEVELHCAPACAHPLLRRLARRYRARLRAQGAGDLGQRMHTALAEALGRRAAAVLVGSDCPALGPRELRAAFAALAGGMDAVIAPAADGGYALIGLRRSAPLLFEGIAWGGPRVLEQTRARLRALGLRWRELPQVRDVDRALDLARLRRAPRALRLP